MTAQEIRANIYALLESLLLLIKRKMFLLCCILTLCVKTGIHLLSLQINKVYKMFSISIAFNSDINLHLCQATQCRHMFTKACSLGLFLHSIVGEDLNRLQCSLHTEEKCSLYIPWSWGLSCNRKHDNHKQGKTSITQITRNEVTHNLNL